MNVSTLSRRLVAEGIGTALLVTAVVGSGIMAETLSGGNVAIALLANTVATVAALLALILTFGPISGAHFNPAVTLVALWRREIAAGDATVYVVGQIVGGIAGTMLAHAMFALPVVTLSEHVRAGWSQGLSEAVATFGLLATIISTSRHRPGLTPFAVSAFIAGAYWFTASTSFANPAVTIARSLTNTFAGIRPADVPLFVAAELVGAAGAVALFGWLLPVPPLSARAPSTADTVLMTEAQR